ncbi:F0F1 ATP synthase subunit B [Spiroplasma turonicum]|uniref:ATP synthase subunit b n=1 Tax=Spiroplasma turonicum TaxID=216946 RepID=A0A0K1P4T4_9MOLU|nr:F0F1 ATP synthase subunit B [Spiroplasma turonicum]AKU79293.1 F0F1 ATP synthase subunit B [Spiroplasma turonicum]ALX70316.1 F0F1 ATP synthase subunit B [Spiroplasma turonicum]
MINFLDDSQKYGLPNIIEGLFPNLPILIAHILSTIVIILLLSKLVYKPFRQAIKDRRKKINALLDEASSKQTIANKNNADAARFLEKAKDEAKGIVDSARWQADSIKFEIINNAKKEAQNIQEHANKILDFEKNEARETIRKEIIDIAFDVAEKVVAKSISKSDNEKLINDFLDSIDGN